MSEVQAVEAEEVGAKVDVMSSYHLVTFLFLSQIGFWITTEPLWDFTKHFYFSDQW